MMQLTLPLDMPRRASRDAVEAAMPWTEADAPRHTEKASTGPLRALWAKVANAALERGEDEGTAIREANAATARAARGGGTRWT